jgi:hypothetical protein
MQQLGALEKASARSGIHRRSDTFPDRVSDEVQAADIIATRQRHCEITCGAGDPQLTKRSSCY